MQKRPSASCSAMISPRRTRTNSSGCARSIAAAASSSRPVDRGSRLLEDTLVEEDIHPVYVSAGVTDVGRLRSTNQDAFAELVAGGLWVVADGMGGYRDGDVASRMVCDSVRDLAGDVPFEGAIDTLRQRMTDVNT